MVVNAVGRGVQGGTVNLYLIDLHSRVQGELELGDAGAGTPRVAGTATLCTGGRVVAEVFCVGAVGGGVDTRAVGGTRPDGVDTEPRPAAPCALKEEVGGDSDHAVAKGVGDGVVVQAGLAEIVSR